MISSRDVLDFLSTVRDDDSARLVANCFDVLDTYNVSDYMSKFELAYTRDDQVSDDDRAIELLECARNSMLEVLTVQGIRVSTDVSLRKLIELTRGVFDIIFYEDKQRMQDICNSLNCATEKLAMLLALTTAMTVEESLPLLNRVGSSTIKTLQEQLLLHPEDIVPFNDLATMTSNYLVFKDSASLGGAYQLHADIYVRVPTVMGLDYDVYLKSFLAAVTLDTTPTPQELQEVAIQLIALSLISRDGYLNSLIVIKKSIPSIYPDIATAVNLEKIVSTVLIDYHKVLNLQ